MTVMHHSQQSLLPYGRALLLILSFVVRQLISSGYLFAKVSLYFLLCVCLGPVRIFYGSVLTNPEDLNKFIHNPLLAHHVH